MPIHLIRHFIGIFSVSTAKLVSFVSAAAFFVVSTSNVNATALLSEELQLHVPWVLVQDKVFSVDLSYSPCESGACFTVNSAAERTMQPPDGAAAQVDLTDLTLHIPLISFQSNLYSADLKYYPLGDSPRFAVTGVSLVPSPAGRGNVITVMPLSIKTKEEITAAYSLIGFTASYGVSMNKITYGTADPFGNLTQASGLMAIPLNLNVAAPLASYQHGTLVEKSESPSSPTAPQNGYDRDLVTIMAASGYVIVAPDYLGFDDSPGLHSYVHAKSLAATVIDILRSARAYCEQKGIPLNGQLFLGGYSEGGYATMAAHKEMETYYSDEFVVTASAPAAGSYDLSGSTLKRFLSDAPYQEPYFLPYFLLAYNGIYGLVDSYTDLFAAPYDVSVPPLFDGTRNEQDINSVLPSVPKDMLSPQLLQAMEGQETSVVKTALRENDVYRWTPRAPMRLYHCTGDQLVPYENSVTAYAYFVQHDASNVELVLRVDAEHLFALIVVVEALPVLQGIIAAELHLPLESTRRTARKGAAPLPGL